LAVQPSEAASADPATLTYTSIVDQSLKEGYFEKLG